MRAWLWLACSSVHRNLPSLETKTLTHCRTLRCSCPPLSGALAGINAAGLANGPARQPSDLQAQAALLLSGLGGGAAGLMAPPAGLPGTPTVAGGGIPAAWSAVAMPPSMQQSPE